MSRSDTAEFLPVRDLIEPLRYCISKSYQLGRHYLTSWNEFSEWFEGIARLRWNERFYKAIKWFEVHQGPDFGRAFRLRLEDMSRDAERHFHNHKRIVVNHDGKFSWRMLSEMSKAARLRLSESLFFSEGDTPEIYAGKLKDEWDFEICPALLSCSEYLKECAATFGPHGLHLDQAAGYLCRRGFGKVPLSDFGQAADFVVSIVLSGGYLDHEQTEQALRAGGLTGKYPGAFRKMKSVKINDNLKRLSVSIEDRKPNGWQVSVF